MIIFFFSSRRRHTRYWRDWSSDVCSSDLVLAPNGRPFTSASIGAAVATRAIMADLRAGMDGAGGGPPPFAKADRSRSEERRVGKECRSRRSPYNYKKKKSFLTSTNGYKQ